MNAKRILACSLVAFSVALAVVVGNRMSAEAMAVVIGVVCGVTASIPMSAIILALSRRSQTAVRDDNPSPASTPPFFVVAASPPAPPAVGWPDANRAYRAPAIPAPREYRIIGDEQF
jgi:hypothetical protein